MWDSVKQGNRPNKKSGTKKKHEEHVWNVDEYFRQHCLVWLKRLFSYLNSLKKGKKKEKNMLAQ